jgi:hypothetical protein
VSLASPLTYVVEVLKRPHFQKACTMLCMRPPINQISFCMFPRASYYTHKSWQFGIIYRMQKIWVCLICSKNAVKIVEIFPNNLIYNIYRIFFRFYLFSKFICTCDSLKYWMWNLKQKGKTKPSFWKYLAMVVTCVVMSFLWIIGGTQFRFVVLGEVVCTNYYYIIFFVIIEIKDPPPS